MDTFFIITSFLLIPAITFGYVAWYMYKTERDECELADDVEYYHNETVRIFRALVKEHRAGKRDDLRKLLHLAQEESGENNFYSIMRTPDENI